ncbi:MAG: tyrosine-type recombinase/integrase, partial [Candidatus Uhrbacteria bacterium]|nr:tyrosine-type recombinase/integrase [Candidatus Uhrbacteria bacterium]
ETYVKTNNKSSEQRYKRSVLRKHLVPLFGRLPLNQISPIKIEEFKVLGLKNGLAPKSVNNCLSILRKSLNDARDWEIIENVPKMKFLKVPPSKFDFLSEDECGQLLAAISDQFWYSMVLTAMKTGLRLSELIGLRWEDMSLSRQMLSVKRGIVRGVVGSPKSNKERHIPLTLELCDVLRQRAKKEGWVFSVRNDNPLDHKTPSDALTRFCKRAGLRCIGWHKLRHTFASHLAMKGVPLKAVQELLGHSDIQTTMRYAHLSPSALRDAISVLEPKSSENNIFGQRVDSNAKFSPNRSFESLFSSDEFALYEKQKRSC